MSRTRRRPPGRILGLHALDSGGRRLDLDAWDSLRDGGLRELAARPAESEVAAYALEIEGEPTVVLPAALGAAAILEAVTDRVPRRRGPHAAGPQVQWTADLEVMGAAGMADEGWAAIVQFGASWWLANGRPPTQQEATEALGYADQSSFARAIRPLEARPGEAWFEVRLLALVQLRRWYDRLLAQVDPVAGPTLEQQRLLRRFEGPIFEGRPGYKTLL